MERLAKTQTKKTAEISRGLILIKNQKKESGFGEVPLGVVEP